ncbi:hypothetical protein C0J52_24396 [Blattella germanica]|nr:hypothetical protein C0J52_24396 [Blattella germanica]
MVASLKKAFKHTRKRVECLRREREKKVVCRDCSIKGGREPSLTYSSSLEAARTARWFALYNIALGDYSEVNVEECSVLSGGGGKYNIALGDYSEVNVEGKVKCIEPKLINVTDKLTKPRKYPRNIRTRHPNQICISETMQVPSSCFLSYQNRISVAVNREQALNRLLSDTMSIMVLSVSSSKSSKGAFKNNVKRHYDSCHKDHHALTGEERTKILQEMKEASDCANNEDKGTDGPPFNVRSVINYVVSISRLISRSFMDSYNVSCVQHFYPVLSRQKRTIQKKNTLIATVFWQYQPDYKS